MTRRGVLALFAGLATAFVVGQPEPRGRWVREHYEFVDVNGNRVVGDRRYWLDEPSCNPYNDRDDSQ